MHSPSCSHLLCYDDERNEELYDSKYCDGLAGRSVRLSIFLDQSFASYHKNLFACLSHTETYGATSVISSWRHKKIEMNYQWRGCHIYIKLYTRHSAKSKTIPFKETFSVTYWRGRVDCTIFTILYVCVARNESERAAHPAWQISVRSLSIFIYYSRHNNKMTKLECIAGTNEVCGWRWLDRRIKKHERWTESFKVRSKQQTLPWVQTNSHLIPHRISFISSIIDTTTALSHNFILKKKKLDI